MLLVQGEKGSLKQRRMWTFLSVGLGLEQRMQPSCPSPLVSLRQKSRCPKLNLVVPHHCLLVQGYRHESLQRYLNNLLAKRHDN